MSSISRPRRDRLRRPVPCQRPAATAPLFGQYLRAGATGSGHQLNAGSASSAPPFQRHNVTTLAATKLNACTLVRAVVLSISVPIAQGLAPGKSAYTPRTQGRW